MLSLDYFAVPSRKKSLNCLDGKEYLKKVENEVLGYVNSYAIYDDIHSIS